MAKFNLKVFKKGKPIYWVIGGLVVFFVFFFIIRSGGSTSSTRVVSSGPSEAMQIANLQASTQLQAANISAGIEMARIAGEHDTNEFSANVALAQIMAGENVALQQMVEEVKLAKYNIDANMIINEQNLSYGMETARVASETALKSKALDIGLLTHQLDTQAAMFVEQSKNLTTQSLISQIGNLKKKNRDEALIAIGEVATGKDIDYVAQRGGGFNPFKVVGGVAGIIA